MGSGLDGFAELTLESSDPESLADFYCRAFRCETLSREEGRIWLKVGRHARLGLWTPGAKEFGDRGGRQVHFAFRVDAGTLDSLVEHLGRMDVSVQGPVEHEGGDRSLYVEDPEGNVVEAWDFFDRQGDESGVAALGGS